MTRKMRTNYGRPCALCTHDEAIHLVDKNHPAKRGPCGYGHDTATGGCKCPGFKAHRRGKNRTVMPSTEGWAGLLPLFTALIEDLRPIVRILGDVVQGKALEEVAAEMRVVQTAQVRAFQEAWGSSQSSKPVGRVGHKTAEALRAVRDADPSTPPTAPAGLSECEHAILRVLVARGKPSTRAQVAILSEYSARSGSFAQALAALRDVGYMTGSSNALEATLDGRKIIGHVPPLPTGRQALEHWRVKLGECEGAILQVLAQAYPAEVDRERLASSTGYSARSGSFAQALAKLRKLELVDGFRASSALMGDG